MAPTLILRDRLNEGLGPLLNDIADTIARTGHLPSGLLALVDPDRIPPQLPEPRQGALIENKIIEIPKAKRGTEKVVAVAAVPPGGTLQVHSRGRVMSLPFKDLENYLGARASRGGLLPRGWQRVDGLSVES